MLEHGADVPKAQIVDAQGSSIRTDRCTAGTNTFTADGRADVFHILQANCRGRNATESLTVDGGVDCKITQESCTRHGLEGFVSGEQVRTRINV